MSRFRWFKKCKCIINIPSMKTWFKLYWSFLQPLCSWCERNMFVNIEPKCDPVAGPSTWMRNLLLNVKNDSLVVNFSKSLKLFLDSLLTKASGFWKSFLFKILIDSSMGSNTVNSFWVTSDRMETKNFAH